jgi:hypothetical protein
MVSNETISLFPEKMSDVGVGTLTPRSLTDMWTDAWRLRAYVAEGERGRLFLELGVFLRMQMEGDMVCRVDISRSGCG